MKYLFIIGACLVGALDIRNAIVMFQKELYFVFGLDVMLAIWMATMIWKIV